MLLAIYMKGGIWLAQNILVTVLTVLFYLSSLLGGNSDPKTTPLFGNQNPTIVNPPAISRQNDKIVMGYMFGNQSLTSIDKNSQLLTSISPWSWSVDSYGGLSANFNMNQFAELLQTAGSQEIETYALIHNYFNNSFDSRVISSLLNNPVARKNAIDQIHSTLTAWGMTGINLDFENVPPSDRELLTSFVAELAEKLRADGLKITMAVPAKNTDNWESNHSGAYDYEALAKHVDQLVIMAYDEHYRGGEAGPVASITWVESVIEYALSKAPKQKIVLGIPAYGYDWPQAGVATGLTYQQAMEKAAAEDVTIRWHGTYRVPFYEYGLGNQVWFENRYSFRYKVDLVNQYDLAGIAIWRLGQEDPGIWEIIEKNLS